MKFGMARDIITPDIAMPMSGYGSYHGKTYKGVHDDLYVKALWMDDGNQGILLITLDLLFHDVGLTESIRQFVYDKYGVLPDNIIVSCTHTHSGPAIRGYDVGQYSEYYEQFLLARIESCINRLFLNTFTGYLSYGSVEGEWNINRRKLVDGQMQGLPNPDGITDNELHILKITDSAGQPKGLMLDYACHPVTIRDTLYLSGDFPGRINQYLETRLFGITSLFFQGAGGNSRPRVTASGSNFITCTFNEVDDMAAVMANRILDAVCFGKFEPIELKLAAKQFTIPVDIEPYSKEVFAEAALNERLIPSLRNGAKYVLDSYDKMEDQIVLHAGIIRLNEHLYIASLGGEPCVEVKQNIEKAFAGKKMIFIGYTDATAYIPDDKIIEEGGYEADGSVIEMALKGKFIKGIDRKILTAFKQNLDILSTIE